MAEERLEETDAGYYVRNGDVKEWQWKPGHEPGATPYPEFEPQPEEPKVEPKRKVTKK